MTKVTQEMIGAAHDVTMRHKIVLGHELLTEIYQAMNAKRKFVGLTEDERLALAMHENFGSVTDYAHAIEAKLREKNA